MNFDVLLPCYEEISKSATVSPLTVTETAHAPHFLPSDFTPAFFFFVALAAGPNTLMASTTDYLETFSALEEFGFPAGCQSTCLQGSVQTFHITLGAIFYRWLSRR